MNEQFRQEFRDRNLASGLDPEQQCLYCGDPLGGPVGGVLNEDGDAHICCEEENELEIICCPVCFEPSSYCQGHGKQELSLEPDCVICEEPVDYFRFDSVCSGHTLFEVKGYRREIEKECLECQPVAL